MKMLNRNLLILLVLFFIGCRSTKTGVSEGVHVNEITDSRLLEMTQQNYVEFRNFYVKKYNAEISFGDLKKSFSGSLFLQKDSQLVITVAPLLGIELFRAKLGLDTVFLIDRTKKDVYKGSYNLIEKYIPLQLNFDIVEAVFSNRMFVVNETNGANQSLNRFKHSIVDNQYVLANNKSSWLFNTNRNVDLVQSFQIDPSSFKLGRSVVIDTKSNSGMTVEYGDLKSTESGIFPHRISFKGFKGTQKFEATFVFNSVEINSKNSLRLSIPDRYSVKEIK